MPSKADILFHPIRLRIVQELSKSDYPGLELLHQLQDVPQATFYRHLKVLVDHNLVQVVEESAGAKEKVYTLSKDGSRMTADDVKDLSPEEHMQMMTVFTSQLLLDAETYFESRPDYTAAKFGYGKVELHLSEDEWATFSKELSGLIQEYAKLKRRPETTTVTLTQYLIPETKKGGQSHET